MVPGALKEEHYTFSPTSSLHTVPNWFGQVELNALYVPRYNRNPDLRESRVHDRNSFQKGLVVEKFLYLP